ncbi:MAG: hypothetical protein ACMG57_05485 [Candidatus Dojkabacteria bacterium]
MPNFIRPEVFNSIPHTSNLLHIDRFVNTLFELGFTWFDNKERIISINNNGNPQIRIRLDRLTGEMRLEIGDIEFGEIINVHDQRFHCHLHSVILGLKNGTDYNKKIKNIYKMLKITVES